MNKYLVIALILDAETEIYEKLFTIYAHKPDEAARAVEVMGEKADQPYVVDVLGVMEVNEEKNQSEKTIPGVYISVSSYTQVADQKKMWAAVNEAIQEKIDEARSQTRLGQPTC